MRFWRKDLDGPGCGGIDSAGSLLPGSPSESWPLMATIQGLMLMLMPIGIIVAVGSEWTYRVHFGGTPGVYTNQVFAGTNLTVTAPAESQAPLPPGRYYFAATTEGNGLVSDYSAELEAQVTQGRVSLAWDPPSTTPVTVAISVEVETSGDLSNWAGAYVLPVVTFTNPVGTVFYRAKMAMGRVR